MDVGVWAVLCEIFFETSRTQRLVCDLLKSSFNSSTCGTQCERERVIQKEKERDRNMREKERERERERERESERERERENKATRGARYQGVHAGGLCPCLPNSWTLRRIPKTGRFTSRKFSNPETSKPPAPPPKKKIK